MTTIRNGRTWLHSALALVAMALPATGAATVYYQQAVAPGATPTGFAAVGTCANGTAASALGVAATGTRCTNQNVAFNLAASATNANVAIFVRSTAYASAQAVGGAATGNSLVVASTGTGTSATFTATLGYVTGTAFTAFAGAAPTFAPGATATQWNPNLSTMSGTVPAGSFAAVRITATNPNAAVKNVTVYYGTNGGIAASNAGTFDLTDTPPPVPGTPSVAAPTSTTGMTVSWSASAGATSYSLDRDTTAAFSAPVTATATSPAAQSGLTSNTVYYYRVRAVGPGGTSANSATGSGTTVAAAPTGLAASGATSSSVNLSWTAPSGNGAPTYTVQWATDAGFTTGLGSSPGLGTTSTTVNGLAASTTYWFRVSAVNAGGTSLPSTSATLATTGATAAEGDPTPNSQRPTVMVVNPGKGAIVGARLLPTDTNLSFKLQLHVYSPTAPTTGPLDILALDYTTGATPPTCATNNAGLVSRTPPYDAGVRGAIYETTVALPPGTYTLRVCARNAAGTVLAAPVAVTVGPEGDGALLVRDNASQLCTDCHALQSHGSQATGAKYGAWTVSCRDCHVPHGTRNIYLVGENITPPAVNGPQPTRAVRFARTTGDSGVVGATDPANSSYANQDGSGPCQVCHTRTSASDGTTARFRVTGNADTHYTGTGTQNCASCHLHNKGFAASCSGCHGDPNRAGEQTSPPRDTCGNLTGGRVGAHQAHLAGGALSVGIACAECHINPPVGAHPSYPLCDPATGERIGVLNFGALARTVLPGDATTSITPTWDGTSCSNYCHGNFKNGNRTNLATWNGTAACGSCHGTPGNALPPLPHPQVAQCDRCHSTGYTATSISAAVRPLHVDGRVDTSNFTCSSCHGTDGVNAAPPIAATTRPNAIGAHQVHLLPGAATLTTGFACTQCHPNNTAMDHSNLAVDMVWGPLANQGTVTLWNAGASTCATNYCHGGGGAANLPGGGTTPLRGGSGTTPNWLNATGTFRNCGACHGNPPPITANHPQGTVCADCHGAGYAATLSGGAIATHVNGGIELTPEHSAPCTGCHGNATRTVAPGVVGADPVLLVAAPEIGTRNETATTTRAVGAHQAHLNRSPTGTPAAIDGPLGCSDCHVVPGFNDKAHADGTVAMQWSALASNGGALTVNWNGTTCSNVYCHGGATTVTPSGSNKTPNWTGGNSQAACGTCHGNPPLTAFGGHPQNVNCSQCHGPTTGGYTQTTVPAAVFNIHINRTLDLDPARTGCVACHGNAAHSTPVVGLAGTENATLLGAAPPNDTLGNSAGTARRVGAHAAHVNLRSVPLRCADCHNQTIPTGADTSHANGATPIAFAAAGLANTLPPGVTSSPPATWNGANATCASVYCHGAKWPANVQGTNVTPAFTDTLGCGGCHGSPPADPIHRSVPVASGVTTCAQCHPGVTAAGAIIVTSGTHVNGTVDILPNLGGGACGACHGDITASRTNLANPTLNLEALQGSPPRDVAQLASSRAVGTHAVHTGSGGTTSTRSMPQACDNCHDLQAILLGGFFAHADGTVNVSWNGPVNNTGTTYAPGTGTTGGTCGSTYCHGNFTGGTSATSPAWNVPGTLTCAACHLNPPPITAGHPQNNTCATCHGAGYTRLTATTGTVVRGQGPAADDS